MPLGIPVHLVNRFGQDTSLNIDAFGRLRISEPYTLQDNKDIFGSNPAIWDELEVSGSGTSTIVNTNRASVSLHVSANTVGRRVRQTKHRPPYQPGKSQLVMLTSVIGSASNGISKKVGVFDDKNGLYFEHNNGVFYVCKRSYDTGVAVDVRVPQSDWNVDTLEGDGISRFHLNPSAANIYFINFEWLGVGEVFFGIVSDGVYHPCHIMKHSNTLTHVYMSSPNLPVRAEIENTGAGDAETLELICSTVISEGGRDPTGFIRSYDRGSVAFACPADANVYPLVCVKIKSTHIGAFVQPIDLSVISANTVTYRWALVLNPTFVGTQPIFTDAIDGFLAYNTTTTSATTVTGGTVLMSGYAEKTNATVHKSDLPISYGLGHTIDNVSDVLVLTVCSIQSKTDNFFGSIIMKEVV